MHKKKNHLQTLTRMNRVLIQIWLDNWEDFTPVNVGNLAYEQKQTQKYRLL
jgi:hypothetical protein